MDFFAVNVDGNDVNPGICGYENLFKVRLHTAINRADFVSWWML